MFSGEIVTLGALEREHLELWRGWINDPQIAHFVDRVLPVTAHEHERFFESSVQGNTAAVWFALSSHRLGRYIGNVWLWNINQRHRNAEVRILIGDREAWGTGAGTEAIDLITNYAFEKLGLHKLYAYVLAHNPRAKAAFLKAGYVEEATLREEQYSDGSYGDVYRVCRLRPRGLSASTR